MQLRSLPGYSNSRVWYLTISVHIENSTIDCCTPSGSSKNALAHLSVACHECALTCTVWTYVHVYLSKHICTAPKKIPLGADFLCPLLWWEEMGISLLAMGLQIPCDLLFLLIPLHCPWLRTTRVASFLQVNVRKGPRNPDINNTKWLYSTFSFESFSTQWGRQGYYSLFVDEETEAHTSHTHVQTCTYL